MTRRTLNKIKKKLPKKWAETLAKKCNLSPSHVRNILNGHRSNIDVINEAIELASKFQEELKQLKQKV